MHRDFEVSFFAAIGFLLINRQDTEVNVRLAHLYDVPAALPGVEDQPERGPLLAADRQRASMRLMSVSVAVL
jgi:hypothetical protein